MFEVVLCEEKMPLPYHHLIMDKKTQQIKIKPQVLCDLITHKFNDRVLPGVGLLIDLFDIVRAYEVKSLPDVPVAYVRIVFRYIVFNPPIDSVWEAEIVDLDQEQIRLAVSFFSDIYIPYQNLPEASQFDDVKKEWFWMDEEADDDSCIKFSRGDMVKFRVTEVIFHDNEKDGPLMKVIGLMNSNGLGIKSWWDTPGEGEIAE